MFLRFARPGRVFVALFAILVGVTSFSNVASAQTQVIESDLPGNAIFTVSGASLADSWKALNATEFGKSGFGKQFDGVRTALAKADRPSMLHLRPWFGFDWAELSTVDAPTAFFLVPNGNEFGASWWFGKDPKAPHVAKLLDASVKHFEGKKLTAVKVNVAGAAGTAFVRAAKDDPATAGVGPVWVLSDKGVFVTGNYATAVEIAKAIADPKLKISAGDGMKKALDAAAKHANPKASQIRILVRPLELISLIQRTVETESERNGKAKTPDGKAPGKGRPKKPFMQALQDAGGDALQAMGATIDLMPGEAEEIRGRGLIVIKRPLKRGAKLLEIEPIPAPTIPATVPADIGMAVGVGMDFQKALDALGIVLGEATGEPDLLDDMIDGLRDDPDTRLDLRKDLFPLIGKKMLVLSDGRGEFEMKAAKAGKPPELKRRNGARRVTLFDVKNPKSVNGFAGKVFDGVKGVTRAPVGEDQAWRTKEIPLFKSTDWHAAVVQQKASTFVTASHFEFLDHTLGGSPGKLLTADADFLRVQKFWDDPSLSNVSLWAYIHPIHQFGPAYEESLAPPKDPMTESWNAKVLRFLFLGDHDLTKVKNELRAMPPFPEASRYWRPVGVALGEDANGLRIDTAWLGK